MWNAKGYYSVTGEDGKKLSECDTFTCAHCNRVVRVPPNAKPDQFGNMCQVEMRMICRACDGKGCTPFEKKLERIEARDRFLKDVGV